MNAIPIDAAQGRPYPVAKRDLARILRYTLIVLLGAIYLAPLVVTIVSSFKTPAELQTVLSLPTEFYTRNYTEGWSRIGQGLVNSALITFPAVILSVFVGACAAFPLSNVKFRGDRLVYLLLLAGMLVPHQVVQIPLFLIVKALGLYNTRVGLCLVHVAYGVPFCTFFMRNFFASIPRSMFEAAQIDGCGPAGYFFKILLPASLSGISALAIVQSRSIWNDLFFGLTITSNKATSPAPVALYSLIGGMETDEGAIMAATIMSFLPITLAFLLFQKAFIRGLLGGSGK